MVQYPKRALDKYRHWCQHASCKLLHLPAAVCNRRLNGTLKGAIRTGCSVGGSIWAVWQCQLCKTGASFNWAQADDTNRKSPRYSRPLKHLPSPMPLYSLLMKFFIPSFTIKGMRSENALL